MYYHSFFFIAALQTALITWQHFSPFERESNLRAVLWGAKPAPRYWAVLALDVCTVLLVFVLALGRMAARARRCAGRAFLASVARLARDHAAGGRGASLYHRVGHPLSELSVDGAAR